METAEESNSTYITKLDLPASRLKECWEVLCDSNPEFQLAKSPRQSFCFAVSWASPNNPQATNCEYHYQSVSKNCSLVLC